MRFSSLCASTGFSLVDEWTVLLYLSNANFNWSVQLPLLNLTRSCMLFFIVLKNLSATLACVKVMMWLMPSPSKNCNNGLERSVVVRIDGHRETHYLKTILQCLKNAHSVFVLHGHYISELAEDVYDHQTVSRLVVFDYDDFLVRFLLNVFGERNHVHYVYLILKTGKGCCVGIVPSVLSNLFVRLFFEKRLHVIRRYGAVFFLCSFENVLDRTETFGGVIVDVADDVVFGQSSCHYNIL